MRPHVGVLPGHHLDCAGRLSALLPCTKPCGSWRGERAARPALRASPCGGKERQLEIKDLLSGRPGKASQKDPALKDFDKC